MSKDYKGILAIDFDDTIYITKYPHIIKRIKGAKKYINKLVKDGWFVIIWTCRCDDNNELLPLNMADERLVKDGILFHQLNNHHPELINFYGNDGRKISADFYIDDKNIFGLKSWKKMYKWLSTVEFKTQLSYLKKEELV